VLDRCYSRFCICSSGYFRFLEALNCNIDDYVINQTSIHRNRESYRCERAERGLIKLQFKKSPPNYAIVHWDGNF